jgi:hypothetical protein
MELVNFFHTGCNDNTCVARCPESRSLCRLGWPWDGTGLVLHIVTTAIVLLVPESRLAAAEGAGGPTGTDETRCESEGSR